MDVNPNVLTVESSQTLLLNQKAHSLMMQGKDIVNFTAGEPDFNTPERIQKAAIEAMKKGETKYTSSHGILPLRKAVLEKIKKQYHRTYTEDEVVITSGGKQAIFNLCLSLLRPGDEVIILAPYWVSYKSIVELVGAKPVIVECQFEDGFLPDVERIKTQLSPKTRMMIINSPCNPTGAVFTPMVLKNLSRFIETCPNLFILTDDIYEKFVFEGEFFSIGMISDFPKENLLILNGVSKTYSMTGWRVGYLVGPSSIVSLVSKISSQSTSNVCSISQWAALEAISGNQVEEEKEIQLRFEQRRKLMFKNIQNISGLSCIFSQGAFYLFPSFHSYLGKKYQTDVELCEYLLHQGVACVPGSAFGAPGYMRFSYGLLESEIERGMEKLKKALGKLV